MKPPRFTYHRPRARNEVDALLRDHGPHAKLLAGGQSLIPLLNQRRLTPAHVIDLGGLADEPQAPTRQDGVVTLGPLVRHEAVETSGLVRDEVPLLHEAVGLVAHPPVRSRGTFVGAIAHADPASELPPVLVLLGGEVRARSSRGARTVAADAAFAGPYQPAIHADEWIEEVRLPRRQPGESYAVEEFTRRDADFAVCGVAARVRDAGGTYAATLAFFGVGRPPRRLALPSLRTTDIAGEGLETAVRDLVTQGLDPHDDVHATAGFRRHLAERLAVRAIRRAATAKRGTE